MSGHFLRNQLPAAHAMVRIHGLNTNDVLDLVPVTSNVDYATFTSIETCVTPGRTPKRGPELTKLDLMVTVNC